MSLLKPLDERFPIEREVGSTARLAHTIAYSVPSNATFSAKAVPAGQVTGKLNTPLMIQNLRIALEVAASALGMCAVSR
ncbi:MAG: hypothetical protein P1V34_01360 [Alphaproteobacteria bacterium]|nr:hypothetical protein [Alphaproteobacteria bacterium]